MIEKKERVFEIWEAQRLWLCMCVDLKAPIPPFGDFLGLITNRQEKSGRPFGPPPFYYDFNSSSAASASILLAGCLSARMAFIASHTDLPSLKNASAFFVSPPNFASAYFATIASASAYSTSFTRAIASTVMLPNPPLPVPLRDQSLVPV